MAKLCINSRDELRIVDLGEVLYLQASGNYTDFHLVGGQVRSLVDSISGFETAIRAAYGRERNPFCRLGRSFLVNTDRVQAISLPRQSVTFLTPDALTVGFPKGPLRALKQAMAQAFTPQTRPVQT